jgi:hypothetical protein
VGGRVGHILPTFFAITSCRRSCAKAAYPAFRSRFGLPAHTSATAKKLPLAILHVRCQNCRGMSFLFDLAGRILTYVVTSAGTIRMPRCTRTGVCTWLPRFKNAVVFLPKKCRVPSSRPPWLQLLECSASLLRRASTTGRCWEGKYCHRELALLWPFFPCDHSRCKRHNTHTDSAVFRVRISYDAHLHVRHDGTQFLYTVYDC